MLIRSLTVMSNDSLEDWGSSPSRRAISLEASKRTSSPQEVDLSGLGLEQPDRARSRVDFPHALVR